MRVLWLAELLRGSISEVVCGLQPGKKTAQRGSEAGNGASTGNVQWEQPVEGEGQHSETGSAGSTGKAPWGAWA